jgi:hypothetical protein
MVIVISSINTLHFQVNQASESLRIMLRIEATTREFLFQLREDEEFFRFDNPSLLCLGDNVRSILAIVDKRWHQEIAPINHLIDRLLKQLRQTTWIDKTQQMKTFKYDLHDA